jgi:phage-related protein
VEWLGSTIRDLRSLPEYAGPINELRENDEQNRTYRLVYVATFDEAVYILHVFNKKSAHGIATSKSDQEVISRRFEEAKRMHAERTGK